MLRLLGIFALSSLVAAGGSGSVICGDCPTCDCSPLAKQLGFLQYGVSDKLDDLKEACSGGAAHECDEKHAEVADYIVVGTGAAGASLMYRLSNDRDYSVLGFEAGSNFTGEPLIEKANLAAVVQGQQFERYFWQQFSVQDARFANNPNTYLGGRFPWTNGRGNGGGTSINGLINVRGSSSNWQRVQDSLGGALEWSVDAVMRRYREMEDFMASGFTASAARGDGSQRNQRLSLVTRPLTVTDAAQFVADTVSSALNIPIVDDYNDPATDGISATTQGQLYEQIDTAPGVLRESSATAFLSSDVVDSETGRGVDGRRLRLRFRSTVTKLLWDGDRAIGVEYLRDGQSHRAYARRRVILSMGVNTAQFLQTQGIGPRATLEAAGIPVRFENEHVGRHLLNHVLWAVILGAAPGTLSPADGDLPVEGNAFKSGVYFTRDYSDEIDASRRSFLFFNNFFPFPTGATGWATLALQNFPFSEGTIDAVSPDPLQKPRVDFKYLSDVRDLVSARATIRHVVTQILATASNTFLGNPTPGVLNNDTLLDAWIFDNLGPAHHWSSAARMATSPHGANGGVVDVRGRVFGVNGLSVADFNIMPLSSDGNMAGPSFQMGWAIAEFLIEDRHYDDVYEFDDDDYLDLEYRSTSVTSAPQLSAAVAAQTMESVVSASMNV